MRVCDHGGERQQPCSEDTHSQGFKGKEGTVNPLLEGQKRTRVQGWENTGTQKDKHRTVSAVSEPGRQGLAPVTALPRL